MTEHFNGLSPAQDERLTKLAEECAETIVAVCKIQRHGFDNFNPCAPVPVSNRYDLEKEIADVLAAVAALDEAGDIERAAIDAGAKVIAAQSKKYMHHQEPKP